MEKRKLRIYVDTSVFGGVFDRQFAEASKVFFLLARRGVYIPIVSGLVEDEIEKAPEKVRGFFDGMADIFEITESGEEAFALQSRYLDSGIVSRKYSDDALHVATATVSGCPVIVSWNFKHIVNFQRVPMYNAVNVRNGYGMIPICSPLEVIEYDEEKEI